MNFMVLPKIKNFDGQLVRYAQEKLDGYFCEIIIEKDGIYAYLKKRNVDIWPMLSKLPCAESIKRVPFGSYLLGELHCPGRKATSVITMLKESNPELRFTCFAVPLLSNEYLNRWEMERVEILCKNFGLEFANYYNLDIILPTTFDNLKKKALNSGLEGYVLKESHLFGWYKLKPTKTVDCFVTGYTKSTSKSFNGGIKAFKVSVFSDNGPIEIASVSSGLTKEFRMSANPDDFGFKVMEVEFQSVASKGRLQFPRFVRWRDDKDMNDCNLSQLEGL